MTHRVAVLGASGFVGAAVAEALQHRGADVTRMPAPRLRTQARSARGLRLETHGETVDFLAAQIKGATAVVIAAGLADASAGDADGLYGANSLLPELVARAVEKVQATDRSVVRLVHVSSAAVQGRARQLDETRATAPFSPYSKSKALGEEMLAGHKDTVIFRPTSVHGPGRSVTRRLASLLRSPLASVAGSGDAPTPQVLVSNVGDAIAFVALVEGAPPAVVLQPDESLTTASLVRIVGGREPRHVPTSVARGLVSVMMLIGRGSGRAAGVGRRLEMLWFGQDQVEGWLRTAGWKPVAGQDGWGRLV